MGLYKRAYTRKSISRFPFAGLLVKQYFEVPLEEWGAVRVAASRHKVDLAPAGWNYTTQRVGDCVRVWRVS